MLISLGYIKLVLTIKNVIELEDIVRSVPSRRSCGVIFREYGVFLVELLDMTNIRWYFGHNDYRNTMALRVP